MNNPAQDFRFGIRLLMREPLFTSCIVLSLALGVGLNGAAFSYYNALFLKPVPGVENADRVLVLYTSIKDGPNYLPVSYPNFEDLQKSGRSFSQMAAAHIVHVALARGGRAEALTGELVTPNYFETLGIKGRSIGRFFSDQESSQPVVVLSEGLWRRRFSADPAILGQPISLNHRLYTVVGVVRGLFRGANIFAPADLWLPLGNYPYTSITADLFPRRSDQTVQVLAKLRPGVPLAKAESEIKALSTRLVEAFPSENKDQAILPLQLTEAWVHPFGRPVLLRNSLLLLVITGLLLLVSCSNVASMLLIRALQRVPEFALRSALGADRQRLIRQLLTEGVLLGALALPISILIADLGVRLLWKFRPTMLFTAATIEPLDGRVLGFLCITGILSLFLFCLTPVRFIGRPDLASTLRRQQNLPRAARLSSSQRLLVVVEVALCFIAISCATFFLVRLRELQRATPGFASSQLLAATFDLRALGLDPVRARALQERMRERILGLPGVESAAFAENRLLGGFQVLRGIVIDGRDGKSVLVGSGLVDPGFFKTVGVPVLQGRSFSQADRAGAPPVAIINNTVAARLWPNKSPLGSHLYLDAEKVPVEIVGVVADTKLSKLDEPPRPFLYLSFQQRDCLKMSLHIRTANAMSTTLRRAVQREVQMLARDLPVEVEPLSDVVDQSLLWTQATVSLLALLSSLALVVAGIGIYSVTAYTMSRRRFELGMRIALGAQRRSILALAIKDGVKLTIQGAILGTGGAIALTRWSAGLLQTPPPTLASYLACGVLLLTVSLVAALLPATNAVNNDPITALKGSE